MGRFRHPGTGNSLIAEMRRCHFLGKRGGDGFRTRAGLGPDLSCARLAGSGFGYVTAFLSVLRVNKGDSWADVRIEGWSANGRLCPALRTRHGSAGCDLCPHMPFPPSAHARVPSTQMRWILPKPSPEAARWLRRDVGFAVFTPCSRPWRHIRAPVPRARVPPTWQRCHRSWERGSPWITGP